MTDDGRGSRGTGSGGSRGRTGRSSFIAGRRPGAAKASASEDEQRQPTTASSSRASSRSSSSRASDDTDGREEERTKRRRRRAGGLASAGAKAAESRATETKTSAVKAAPEEPEEQEEAAAASRRAAPSAEAAEEKAAEAAAISATAAAPAASPAPARERGAADGDVGAIHRLLEEQGELIGELRAGVARLEQRVEQTGRRARLGVFVDVPNLLYGQDVDEKPINVGKLLDMISDGRELVRATAYSPVSDDPSEALEQQKFVAPFVPYEYRIVTKPLKRFADGSIKGNFDVEMAIDMVTMADRLDVIAIVSGDADFARAVETVQSRGVRVEVVAFARSTSLEMRALADHYVELGKFIDELR